MIVFYFYEKTQKGDNAPWKFCKAVDVETKEVVMFECFPYKHEYLVFGCPISVHHNYMRDLWSVEHREWNTKHTNTWDEYGSREDAFRLAFIKVSNYRSAMKANRNKHPTFEFYCQHVISKWEKISQDRMIGV